jgi:hypothetical protein
MTGMPLAILDDNESKGDPWRRPSFVRGTEQPVLERGENLLVRIVDCAILLETRAAPELPWQTVWRTRRPGQAVVTDRRVVVGCRRYDRGTGGSALGQALVALVRVSGYRRAGTCLGGHFRYEWVSDVSIALGRPGDASHLMLTACEPWLVSDVRALSHARITGNEWMLGEQSRQWRLAVGSAAATAYLPDLVALVANEVAQAHRRGAGPDVDLGPDAELAAADGWPQLRPEPGTTGSVHIPGACPLGTRPIGVDERAWRA